MSDIKRRLSKLERTGTDGDYSLVVNWSDAEPLELKPGEKLITLTMLDDGTIQETVHIGPKVVQ